jgi:hypothetical protein
LSKGNAEFVQDFGKNTEKREQTFATIWDGKDNWINNELMS